jgi:hypothetical protein
MRSIGQLFQVIIVASLASGLSACVSLLPESRSNVSTFNSFEDAKNAVESLKPMQSTSETLKALGIEANTQPNVSLLTHADIVRRLAPGSVLTKLDLDPGIVVCIEAKDACRGLELLASRIAKVRNGNFFSDFLNFSRRTEISGWRFNALILMVNDVVVYRTWGGQPAIHETEVQSNPLGPLQDIGPAAVTSK